MFRVASKKLRWKKKLGYRGDLMNLSSLLCVVSSLFPHWCFAALGYAGTAAKSLSWCALELFFWVPEAGLGSATNMKQKKSCR